MDETFKIEPGQIYTIKPNSKHKENPEAKIIKIDEYFLEGEKEYKIKNLWKILIKNKQGEWISSKDRFLLFKQQIETHYNLEFNAIQIKKPRLSEIED